MVILISKNKNTIKNQISDFFYKGIKKSSDFKIGVEIEKLPVKKNTFKAVSYYEKHGIKDFLEEFSTQDNWEKIKEKNNTIGLKKNGTYITLEPGSQVEISLLPQKNIHDCENQLRDYHKKTSNLADDMGFMWLGYGIQPISTHKDIDLIPKSRYKLMTQYLPQKAPRPLVMMRETAGTQVTLDYLSEEDAIKKLRLGILLSPFVSAIFANSPIRGGLNTGYKSYRAYSWLYTDPERCGLISKKLLNPNYMFTFKDYIETLFDIPMIFVERDNKQIPLKNCSFRKYLEEGYKGLEPSIEDWQIHSSLFFPDVRMKNFIELRNTDCQSPLLSLAIIALYKGIFYNYSAIEKTYNLLKNIDWQTLNLLRTLTPHKALDLKINNISVSNIAISLVEIAHKSLKEQNLGEEIYLEVLKNYTLKKRTPADILLDTCGNDIKKLVDFTRIS